MNIAFRFHNAEEKLLKDLQKKILKALNEGKLLEDPVLPGVPVLRDEKGDFCEGGKVLCPESSKPLSVPFYPLFCENNFFSFSSLKEVKDDLVKICFSAPGYKENSIVVPVTFEGKVTPSSTCFVELVRFIHPEKENREASEKILLMFKDFSFQVKRCRLSVFEKSGFSFSFTDEIWWEEKKS